MTRRPARLVVAILATIALLASAGCSAEQASERSKQDIPLRIGVLFDPTDVAMDPVRATDAASQSFVYNTFQRLMTTETGTGLLKADAAAECTFIDEITYSCSLNTNMTFTNGNRLTASDVKFSIERAQHLAAPGTAAAFFDTLDKVLLVDEDRVDFKLKHPDNQFGHLLASPAASIVDEEVYSPTKVRANSQPPVGSGPVQLHRKGDKEIQYWANLDYRGRGPAQTFTQVVKQYDSAEDLAAAAQAGEVDVVWDAANVPQVPQGFHEDRLAHGQVEWLRWNPESELRERDDLRHYVRDAVQPVRSLLSLLPEDVDTARPVFEQGAREPKTPQAAQVMLWHDDMPAQKKQAETVAELLRSNSAVTVTLTTNRTEADLFLEQPSPWLRTPLGYLQPYLEDPLPGTEDRNAEAVTAMREAFTQPLKQEASTRLQEYARDDATVVPLTVEDQRLYLGPTVELSREDEMNNYLAPGSQLGVWGFSL